MRLTLLKKGKNELAVLLNGKDATDPGSVRIERIELLIEYKRE